MKSLHFHPKPWFPKTHQCISSYDTNHSFEPIFMNFTQLVLVHSWVNCIVFGNNRPNRTTDMGGKCAPKTCFSCLSQMVWSFLKKKLKNCIWYPISKKKKKKLHSFLLPTPHFLKNSHAPKNNFSLLFWEKFVR